MANSFNAKKTSVLPPHTRNAEISLDLQEIDHQRSFSMSKNRTKPINIMPKPIYAQEEKIATRYNHFMKNRESKTSMGAGGARGMAGGSGMGSRSPV